MAKHFLVTGAASGIGLTLTEMLLARGHTVTAMARDTEKAEWIREKFSPHKEQIQTCHANLASFASIRRLVGELAGRRARYDGIVHAAGMLMPPDLPTLTPDQIEVTLQVNAVSPWLMSRLMLPLMRRPARIIALTSSLHKPGSRGADVHFDFGDMNLIKNYHRERAYKNSKLALIWLMRAWERRFGTTEQIHADAICPGFVPTTAARYTHGFTKILMKTILPLMPFAVSRTKAARDILALCESPGADAGGRYFENNKIGTASDDALNDALGEQFAEWVEKKTARWLR
jgi:NAD(P)-dependent dehydrogenase (short-subunit alcohol dehydrogenase family)